MEGLLNLTEQYASSGYLDRMPHLKYEHLYLLQLQGRLSPNQITNLDDFSRFFIFNQYNTSYLQLIDETDIFVHYSPANQFASTQVEIINTFGNIYPLLPKNITYEVTDFMPINYWLYSQESRTVTGPSIKCIMDVANLQHELGHSEQNGIRFELVKTMLFGQYFQGGFNGMVTNKDNSSLLVRLEQHLPRSAYFQPFSMSELLTSPLTEDEVTARTMYELDASHRGYQKLETLLQFIGCNRTAQREILSHAEIYYASLAAQYQVVLSKFIGYSVYDLVSLGPTHHAIPKFFPQLAFK